MNTKKEKFLIELVDSLPQLKLRLPKVSKSTLGQEEEVEFKGRTIIFKLTEDVNGKKVWFFKQTKR